MRVLLFVAFAALAFSPLYVSAQQGGNTPPLIDNERILFYRMEEAGREETTTFSMPEDEDQPIIFSVENVADDVGVTTVRLVMTHTQTCQQIAFNLAKVDEFTNAQGQRVSSWLATFPVAEPKLTFGTWSIVVYAYDAQGGSSNSLEEGESTECRRGGNFVATSITLDVENNRPDPDDLFLRLVGIDGKDYRHDEEVPRLYLGPGDTLTLNSSLNYLWRYTYQVIYPSGQKGPENNLEAPFALGEEALQEGTQSVIFRSYERVLEKGPNGQRNRLTTFTVDEVTLDRQPPSVTIDVPTDVYVDIPFDVGIVVDDRLTNHTVRIAVDDQLTRINGTGTGAANYTIPVTIQKQGNVTLQVIASDFLGNTQIRQRLIDVQPAFTSLEIIQLKTGNLTPLPTDLISFNATLLQRQGLVDMPVTVSFEAPGQTDDQIVLVPRPLALDVGYAEFEGRFQPGMHTIVATATIPPGVTLLNENGTGLMANLTFEVFAGRVHHGEETYFIRVDDRGFPQFAVTDPTTSRERTFPLTLDRGEANSIYVFQAEGVDLYWNPLERDERGDQITTIEVAKPPKTPPTKDSPALGWVGLLGLLAVAVARRR